MKFYKKLFLFTVIICSCKNGFGQITFDKMIVDNANFSYSSGAAVQQTNDGGYVLAGTYRFLLGNEANSYLVKTNQYGDTLWTKVYRDRDSMEIATSVQQTPEGGYILCGWVRDFESSYCWYIRKTDNTGNVSWTKYFTGAAGASRAHQVVLTNDGGYAVAGHFNESTAGLIKLDANGNTLWTKQYYRNDADQVMQAFSLQQTNDNGFILAGYTPDAWPYYNSAFLLKTDSAGNVKWNKAYNHIAGWAYSVRQVNDGGFILAGITGDTLNISDICLIKTDTAGAIEWSKNIGGAGEDWAGEVNQTDDGGYILAGISNSFSTGSFNYNLTKTDATGNVEWSKIYDETTDLPHLNVYPSIYCAKQVSDRGYICSGLFYSNAIGYAMCMIKTDSLGNANCLESSVKPSVADLTVDTSTLPVITLNQIDTLDTRVFGVSSNGIPNTLCITVNADMPEFRGSEILVFPNPARSDFFIRVNSDKYTLGDELNVSISDISGRQVYHEQRVSGRDLKIKTNLSCGVYNVKVISGNFFSVQRLVIN